MAKKLLVGAAILQIDRLNTNIFGSTTLQEISFTTNEVLNEQKRIQSQVLALVPGYAAATSQICQKIEESQTTQLELIRLLDHVRRANLTDFAGEETQLLKGDDGSTDQLINPKSRMGSNHERKLRKVRKSRTCQHNCGCNCHKIQHLSTPWTLRKYIGLGSMRSSNCYSLQKCNIRGCQQSASSILRLHYVLPTWFALRMVSMWYNSSPLHGPELLLRVPLVLPWPKFESSDREVDWQRKLEHVDHWLHTPSHIDEKGFTLLWVCLPSRKGGSPCLIHGLQL